MPDRDHSETVACCGCDMRVAIPALNEGDEALCPRCGERLLARFIGDWQRTGALTVAALVAFALSVSGPFLILSSVGGESVATVLKTPYMLGLESPALGVIVGLLFVGVPFLHLMALLVVSFASLQKVRARWLDRLVVVAGRLKSWSMAEVFMVGTLVSLIKIVSIARIQFGVSFWAFLGFTVLLAVASASFDSRRYWKELRSDGES